MQFRSQRSSKRSKKRCRHQNSRRNGKSRQLRFEGLEDRRVLSATTAPQLLLDLNGISDHDGASDAEGNLLATHSFSPRFLEAVGGTVYFTGEPNQFLGPSGSYQDPLLWSGVGLWKTNGTAAGTTRLDQLAQPNDVGLLPKGAIAFHDQLYFVAAYFDTNMVSETGWELWRSNGTQTGTVRVTDELGEGFSEIGSWMVFNDELYFWADNGTNGLGLWKTDGTTDTAVPVDETTFVPFGMTAFNGAYYYVDNVDGNGQEIWKTDGTTTTRIADINPGAGSSNPTELTVFNGDLYFQATDGDTGYELWKINGMTDEAVQVADINPGADSSFPKELTVFRNDLYFSVGMSDLWKTDGTRDDTVLVLSTNDVGFGPPTVSGLTVFNDALYFVSPAEAWVTELWKTGGTVATTERLTYFTRNEWIGGLDLLGVEGPLFVGGDFALFPASDGRHGIEPWVIRALAPEITPENLAQVVADLSPGTAEVQGTATSTNLNAFVAAIAALPVNTGDEIDIVLNLTEGDYAGAVVNVPAGYRVVLNGESGQIIFHGASPALTLQSGDLLVTGITLVNNTDAASLLVTGGSLTVRNSTIVETTGGTKAAIEITGGSADLGTLGDPGGNTLVVSGTGEFIRNATANSVPAYGNDFQVGTTSITSDVVLGAQKHLVFAAGGLLQLSNVQIVDVDLRPASFNIDQNGALSLVIFGSSLFNVTQVNSATLKLAGVSIDVFNQSLSDANGDGYADLAVSFRTSEALKAALICLYSELLVEDADDGQYSTRQDALVALDGAFGDFGQEFQGTDSASLFLGGKNLKTLLQSLGIFA